MSAKLQEKKTLVDLARRFGQEPPADLLTEIAELEKEEQARLVREAAIKQRISQDLKDIFEGVKIEPGQAIPIADVPGLGEVIKEGIESGVLQIKGDTEPVKSPTLIDLAVKNIAESTLVNPEPTLAQPTPALELKVKYLEQWISRIAATGPGGGAGQVYNLDYPTKSVTGDYTIGRKDYYIGVSSAVKTYITLPITGSNLKDGRVLIVKDESGHAQLTPIKLVGTIDNDPNGAEIRINNGAVQLVYHNGCWRIV